MIKKKINSKIAFFVSGSYSFIFTIFAIYKGVILYSVNKALEDTFVGGETSDISITLWFVISGVMFFTTFLFFYFIKIKDLNSQRIILSGVSISWFIICIFQIILFKNFFFFSIFTLIPLITCYMATKNLKKDIRERLLKKGLSEKEIHLLQLLAGKKK